MQKILVGVSGGPDSMLLSILSWQYFVDNNLPLDHLFFIHLNHSVRPESEQEEKLVRERFADKNLIVIKKISGGKTTENDLRKWRYQQFKNTMDTYNIDILLLGHHLNDRIETTFLNLMRGCGVNGFLSIKAKESHHLLGGKIVLRPLLSFTKQQILHTCQQEHIPFVHDKSNDNPNTSRRNMLRNKFLPEFFKQKKILEIFTSLYKKLEQGTQISVIEPISMSPFRKAKAAYRMTISRKELTAEIVLRMFKELHINAGITQGTITEFLRFLSTSTQGRKILKGMIFFLAHNQVYIFAAPSRFREKTIDTQEIIDTLTVKRYPQRSDRYKGKSRTKYCINQKIPLFRRNFIPLLVKDNKIIQIFIPPC